MKILIYKTDNNRFIIEAEGQGVYAVNTTTKAIQLAAKLFREDLMPRKPKPLHMQDPREWH